MIALITREQIAAIRAALKRATAQPWIVEHVRLDEEGRAMLEEHPDWRHNPLHTVIGWPRADRELLRILLRHLPGLLGAAEAAVEEQDEDEPDHFETVERFEVTQLYGEPDLAEIRSELSAAVEQLAAIEQQLRRLSKREREHATQGLFVLRRLLARLERATRPQRVYR